MIKAIYPGTFDPITNGHLDIIKRAAKTVDVLYVAIMDNPKKKSLFTKEEKLKLIKKCTKNIKNVEIVVGEGLTVDLASQLGCTTIIRGIRAVTDYEYELSQATANMTLNNKIETMLMVSRPELSFISSTIIKEIVTFGGDVTPYIPEVIKKEVVNKILDNAK